MNGAENIYSVKGIEKVFLFTVNQTFKNRGYLLSFILFVLVFTLMGPIQYASSNAGRSAAERSESVETDISEVSNVYILDQTGIVGEDKSIFGPLSSNVSFLSDENAVSEALGEKDVAVIISAGDTGFTLSGIISDSSKLSTETLEEVSLQIKAGFDDTRFEKSGLSEADLRMIRAGVSVSDPVSENENTDGEKEVMSGSSFGLYMLGFSVVVFIVVSMSASYIITSVTEEKQSKLVETLLVSVRPMALLMGKVTGMMSYVILVLICGAVGSSLSSRLMEGFFGIDTSEYGSSSYDFSIFTSFGIVNTILLVISILFAFLLFGMISGLFGSTCNKTEDIQVATGNVMTVAMIGYFAAIVIGFMDNDLVTMIAAVIPPFSFFTAPVAFIAGKISVGLLALSYAIQIAAILFVVRLSAKVYRLLLLSDTTTPGLKTVLRSAKGV